MTTGQRQADTEILPELGVGSRYDGQHEHLAKHSFRFLEIFNMKLLLLIVCAIVAVSIAVPVTDGTGSSTGGTDGTFDDDTLSTYDSTDPWSDDDSLIRAGNWTDYSNGTWPWINGTNY